MTLVRGPCGGQGGGNQDDGHSSVDHGAGHVDDRLADLVVHESLFGSENLDGRGLGPYRVRDHVRDGRTVARV